MPRGIAIVEPFAVVAATTDLRPGPSQPAALRAFTPNPKEAFIIPTVAAATIFYLTVDFGFVRSFDTLYIGYHNATGITSGLEIVTATGETVSTPFPGSPLEVLGYGPPNHTLRQIATPMLAQTVRIGFIQPANAPPISIGVVAIGLAFQTEYGEERGGGGIIEDIGTVERLFGGGFGIDEGVATTGYQWTFGDLQDAERRQLFQIVKRLRTTRSFLMVENPAQTDGLNERIHWSLFRKLEAYERIDPRNSKWSLSCWDWA